MTIALCILFSITVAGWVHTLSIDARRHAPRWDCLCGARFTSPRALTWHHQAAHPWTEWVDGQWEGRP